MPILMLSKSGSSWVPHRFGVEVTQPVGREGLVLGVDKPGPDNTGPYTVSSWEEVYPSAGSNEITINTTEPQYGKRYWGCVKAIAGARIDECWVVGPDPWSYGGGTPGGPYIFGPSGSPITKGHIQNFGTNPPYWEVYDSLLDPSPWLTAAAPATIWHAAGARPTLNPHSTGVHGGNIGMWRTEIINIQDAVNLIGPNGGNATAVANQQHVFEQNWFHKGDYMNDTYPPDDGQPHSDGFQTNTGKNIRVRGNTIGGQRNITGYNVWPGGYNAGDDFWNAGLMLAQEVSINPADLIEDMLIELNWITGGVASINHAYDAPRPNNFASTTVRNNRFGLRGSNWGTKMKGDGPGLPGYNYGTGAGFYIIKSSLITSTYTGNVIDETGAPVPITNG